MRLGERAGYAVMIALGLLLVIGTAISTRQARTGPLTDATVVAVLATGADARSPELVARLRATRADPTDRRAALAAARSLIDEGRAAGDSRTVGAAISVLRPFMDAPDAGTLYLAAEARQYQHDFNGALGLLDQAIRLDPQALNPRLMQATIHTVQGHLDQAAQECAQMGALGAGAVALLCQATALTLTTDAPAVRTRLEGLLQQPGLLDDPTLRTWAVSLIGEIAAMQGDAAAARTRLAEVIAANPASLRERLLLADLLLQDDQPQAVIDLLAPAPPVDGVLIRRVLAADALGTGDPASEAEIGRRVKLNIDLGLVAHAREEADYFLRVAGNPDEALARAQVNWTQQHEYDDMRLLIAAAVAAGKPDAARPVAEWMASQRVRVPVLTLPKGLGE